MTKPVLTGAQVKAIRLKLGLTQDKLGRMLAGGGRPPSPANWIYKVENEHQGRHLTYAQANLLLAIKEGYEPVGWME